MSLELTIVLFSFQDAAPDPKFISEILWYIYDLESTYSLYLKLLRKKLLPVLV